MFFALFFLQSKTATNKQDKHNILVVKLKFVAHFQIWEKSDFKDYIPTMSICFYHTWCATFATREPLGVSKTSCYLLQV
jgi:hypothetical protein